MQKIRINSISQRPSLCNGYGYRTVLFLQGCPLRCKGCQNMITWNPNGGKLLDISELATILRSQCFNKKLTISGGEPLFQLDSLLVLLEELKDFDLCLYTGYEYEDVPKVVLKYLKYIKTGPFILSQKTTVIPFVGSTNQKFIEVANESK